MLAAMGAAFGLGAHSFINGKPVSTPQSLMLAGMGMPLTPGQRYWYDKMTGAYGLEGGPSMGQRIPNVPGYAPLQPHASNGTTGVFVNGRQLHVQDVVALQRMGVSCVPGRFWMNASGQFGYEGSPFSLGQVNLRMAAQQPPGHCVHTSVVGGGNAYLTDLGGGDCYYMDSSNGNSWYPGK